MPRKSRAQKIRHDKALKKRSIEVVIAPASTKVKVETTAQPTHVDPQNVMVADATKKDLIKTVIVIGAIFALEFAIFYATLN